MKRLISLVLVLVLVACLFAGCTKTQEETQNTPAPATQQSSGGNSSGGASSGGQQQQQSGGEEENPAPVSNYHYEPLIDPNVSPDRLTDLKVQFETMPSAKTIALPLAEETATITAYMTFSSELYGGPEDMPVSQELERRTNVHVEYDTSAGTDASETFSLMIASQLYPDIIFEAESYIGGGDKAISDGVYLRLNELIEEYAPNYQACRHLSDTHLRGTLTDEGNMFGFRDLLIDPEPPWCGLTARQDWLDDLGLKSPVTLADWEHMMDEFMQKKGAEYGVAINPAYIRGNNNDEFITTFDVNYEFYQIDGKVQFGPIQQGFLDYLTFAKDWIAKGYILSDFYKYANYGEYLRDDAYFKYGEGHVGAAQTMVLACGHQLLQNGMTDNEEMVITAVKNPVRNVGDKMHFRQVTSPVKASGGGCSAAISTNAKDPVLCTKWLDYRYTQDGVLLISYGVPGGGFSFDESTGTVTFTTEFVNYEDGMKKAYDYFIGSEMYNAKASIYSRVRGSIFTGSDYDDNAAILETDGYDYVIPVDVAFANSDESAEFSALYADIQTYVNEMTIKFMTGQEPLENFPKFVEQIKGMKIDRCIELKQNGLDAYNHRLG